MEERREARRQVCIVWPLIAAGAWLRPARIQPPCVQQQSAAGAVLPINKVKVVHCI